MRRALPILLALGASVLPGGVGASEIRQAIPSAGPPVTVETLQLSRNQGAPGPPSARPAYGCALVGGSAAGLTAFVGAEALLAEAVLAPVAPALVTAGLAGLAFVAFCTVGHTVTPAAIGLAERVIGPAPATEVAAIPARPGPPRSARLLDPAARLRRDGIEAALEGCATSARCARVMEMLHLSPRPAAPRVAGIAPQP